MNTSRSRRKTLWGFLWEHRKIAFLVSLTPYLFPFFLCSLLEPELAEHVVFWIAIAGIVILKGIVWLSQRFRYPWKPIFLRQIKRRLLKKDYYVDFWLDGSLQTGILVDNGKERPGWRQIYIRYRNKTVWVPEEDILPALRYDVWELEQNH